MSDVVHCRSRLPRVGERVLCRPRRLSRQWVHGEVIARHKGKAFVVYGVVSEFGQTVDGSWLRLGRVTRLESRSA